MKPIVLALVALMLLGGGGAGAYFYFMKPAEASTGVAGEVAKAPKPSKKAEPAVFVQLDPLILPIVGQDGVTHVVSLVVVLETTDEVKKKQISDLAPRLKDAFIQDMYGVLNHANMMHNGVIQVTPLKNRMQKVSERVMGDGMVNNVLLQVIQQREI